MWKSVNEIGKIPDQERATAIEMFTSYADSRTADGQGRFMAWVQEAIPNANPELYKNLMNTITALRADFASNQTRLLDLDRERNALIEKIPSKWFISNNAKIDVVIVTSSRTSRAFSSGSDDEIFDISPKPALVE